MDIVGIDISKAKFDAALLVGERVRHAAFSNTEAGFGQLLAWLAKQDPDPAAPIHACMEANGNWGLDLAAFLYGRGVQVSVVNPARIKAYGDSELARNKTDRLDAALIARFCRAQAPPAWTPPATHLRELRELVRRCDMLKVARVQELNRQKSGFASAAVAASLAAHVAWLDAQIDAVMEAVRGLVAADPALARNLVLLRTITGFGEISATILLAELPNVEPRGSPDIADFNPKGLAAFAGLSPSRSDPSPKEPAARRPEGEHSSGSSVRRPSPLGDPRADRRSVARAKQPAAEPPEGQDQPCRQRAPAQHALNVRPQRRPNQQGPARLRRTPQSSRQAAQDHLGRRRPQAARLRPGSRQDAKAVHVRPGRPFSCLTSNTVSPWDRLRRWVQRQYTGTAGRIENAQVGVLLGYASRHGRALIDRALYLPEGWAEDRPRRKEARIPEKVVFTTKPKLGLAMLERARAAGVPFSPPVAERPAPSETDRLRRWITGDSVYGADSAIARWAERHRRGYVLAVTSGQRLGMRPVTTWIEDLPETAWRRLSAGEGAKGLRLYDWAHVPYRGAAEGFACALLVRRNVAKPDEVTFYLTHAPEGTELAELVQVAGARWTIESLFEQAKGEVGLDQYEVRSWVG